MILHPFLPTAEAEDYRHLDQLGICHLPSYLQETDHLNKGCIIIQKIPSQSMHMLVKDESNLQAYRIRVFTLSTRKIQFNLYKWTSCIKVFTINKFLCTNPHLMEYKATGNCTYLNRSFGGKNKKAIRQKFTPVLYLNFVSK